jgi:uncharacterized protein (DUF952 family)
MLIYHMCRGEEWRTARAVGRYEGSAQDKRDGFIHFSTAETIRDSAAKHRAGQADLVLVAVDAGRLGAALRWETARGGQLFPHLYGALNTEDAAWVRDLPLGADGAHVFPERM